MKYGEFAAALRKGGVKHVYLLAGEEPYYIKKAERALLHTLVPDEAARPETVKSFDGDLPFEELVGWIDTMPFFADKTILLIRGTKLFHDKKGVTEKESASRGKKEKDGVECLLEKLSNMPETSYVIFEATGRADKRRKLYKVVEKAGAVLEAERERPWTVGAWLRGKLVEMNREMEREAQAYFMDAVSVMNPIELSFLDEELDKLALSTESRRFSREEIARVFASVPEVSGFAMLDAVSARDVKKALFLLERQLADGTYPPLLLMNLSRHVRQLLQAKELMADGVRGKALGQPLELHPYLAEKLGNSAQNFQASMLRSVFLLLCDADYKMKTGQGGAELLEEAVIRLCR